MKISETNKEDGTLTMDNGLHHDKETRHESVMEHTNGTFAFIGNYSFSVILNLDLVMSQHQRRYIQ